MKKQKIFTSAILLVAFALAGSVIGWILSPLISFNNPAIADIQYKPKPGVLQGDLIFDPPRPEDAPENIRDAVMLGYNILENTQQYASEYVGNDLNCTNCHFDAGRAIKTLSLVGVAAKYPKYRERNDFASDLVTRTNGCFQRSQNGKPLPADSKEMEALMAYYHWISKGIPIYADIPWLGLKKMKSNHQPDKSQGKVVFEENCQMCHGINGQGTLIAPALWGQGSYNDGAGMSKIPNLAAFAHLYMPKGNPGLTEVQSLDVAAFVNTQPRPHFVSTKN